MASVPVETGVPSSGLPPTDPLFPEPGMKVRIHPWPASTPIIDPIMFVPNQIPRAPKAAINELLNKVPNNRTIETQIKVLNRAPRSESGTR